MTESDGVILAVTDPSSPPAREILFAYFVDVVSSFYGHPATRDEVNAAMPDEPSDDLHDEGGRFAVATRDGVTVGCGGVRFVDANIGQLTRIFVRRFARRTGIGASIVEFLEVQASSAGITTLRLDTRLDLVDARRLYERLGYTDVAPFNSGPYRQVWLAKALS
jgi:GNAT superfamily N-acetyltransferase